MSEMIGRAQTQFKKTSGDVLLFSGKLVSGGVLGLTLALIMQEILGKGENENLIGFTFVIIVVTALFLRIAKDWGTVRLVVVDLIVILVGMLLALYIRVAPGA